MRRALLTPGHVAAGPPFTVGENPLAAGGILFGSGYLVLAFANPALRAGTLNTAKFYGSAGAVTLITGTLSGANFTVRQSVALTAATSGLNSLPMSLPIAAGDYLAYWSASSGPSLNAVASSGATYYYATSAAMPTGTVALSTSTGYRVELQAVGS